MRSGIWGILDMHILLTDDTEVFDCSYDLHYPLDVHVLLERLSVMKGGAPIEIKLYFDEHQALLLSLLMTRCPVSIITFEYHLISHNSIIHPDLLSNTLGYHFRVHHHLFKVVLYPDIPEMYSL